MTQSLSDQVSEITEVTERTLDRTFGRHRDLDTLYRDCPSAFWLAPDGDDALPPVDGPLLRRDVATGEGTDVAPAAKVAGRANGVILALAAAGPIFIATSLMLMNPGSDPHWWSPFARALATLPAFPLTITFGAPLALLPVLAGVWTLGRAGKRHATARRPAIWALTGGAMGAAIAGAFGAGGTVGLALIATSVACARIARGAVHWTDPTPA